MKKQMACVCLLALILNFLFVQAQDIGKLPETAIQITEKDFIPTRFQKIETEHVDFELPKHTSRYGNPNGLDTYEVIISNFSIKDEADYILRLTWNDEVAKDTIKIDYEFVNGVLEEENVMPYSIRPKSGMTFTNFTVELGQLIGYKNEIEELINLYQEFDKKRNRTHWIENLTYYNISYPVYEWSNYKDIVLNNKISFTATDDIEVEECDFTFEDPGYYILTGDIEEWEDYCFHVDSDDVIFDMQGHLVQSIEDPTWKFLETYDDYENVTIMNGRVENFGYGFYMDDGHNWTFRNMTFTGTPYPYYFTGVADMRIDGGRGEGNSRTVRLFNTDYSHIKNMFSTGSAGGYVFVNSSHNTIDNITFLSKVGDNEGIAVTGLMSTNNSFNDVTVGDLDDPLAMANAYFDFAFLQYAHHNILTNYTSYASTGGPGIVIERGNNNIVDGFYILLSSSGIYLNVAHNNTLQNGNIPLSVGSFDVAVDEQSPNVTLINVTYSTETIYPYNSYMYRKWWYKAYVNDTEGSPIDGALVTAYNKTGGFELAAETDATGYTPKVAITEYRRGASKVAYSPYTITASKTDYNPDSHSYTASTNKLDDYLTIDLMNITACRNLTVEGNTYIMVNNIIPQSAPCIDIKADDITFNGNGFWIANSTLSGKGINAARVDNITVQSVNVSMSLTDDGYGVMLNSSNYSTVMDSVFAFNEFGLAWYNSSYGTIENITTRNNTWGIDIAPLSSHNEISGISSMNDAEGITISTVSNYNSIAGANIINFANHGIWIVLSENNTIQNCTIKNGNLGVLITGGGGNYFSDSNVSSSGTNVGVSLSTTNNTFVNVTYNTEGSFFGGELTRKWWYQAYVNDTAGDPINNAIITAMNATNDIEFTAFTDATGYTPKTAITDYVNKGGSKTYASPYNIVASADGYHQRNHALTVTDNYLIDWFELEFQCWLFQHNRYTIPQDCLLVIAPDGTTVRG